MKPTNELRWVEREVTVKTNYHPMVMGVDENGRLTPPPADYTYISKVLQQKWVKQVFNGHGEAFDTDVVEWRDIETVKEQP